MKTIILSLILCLSFCSCRVRKMDKQSGKTEQQSKTEEEIDVVVVDKSSELRNETNEKEAAEQQVNTTEESTINAKPVNPEKPIDIVDQHGNKTSYYNAEIEVNNTTTKQNINKQEKEKTVIQDVENNDVKITGNSKKKTDMNNKSDKNSKTVDAKPGASAVYSWIFWILLFLVLMWLFRKKIPFIKNFFV